jgi:chromosome partitioning protein
LRFLDSRAKGCGSDIIGILLRLRADDGKSVALFDLDPQASACFWADRRKATKGETPVIRDVNYNRLPITSMPCEEKAQTLSFWTAPVHRDIAGSNLADHLRSSV